LEERNLSYGEVKEILGKQGEESLSQFQRRTLEYVRKFSKKDAKECRRIYGELMKLGDITDDEAIEIINIAPRSREELRTIFYHRKSILMGDFLDKILEILWGKGSEGEISLDKAETTEDQSEREE
jgi:DNA-directed RNA polymerase subunit F